MFTANKMFYKNEKRGTQLKEKELKLSEYHRLVTFDGFSHKYIGQFTCLFIGTF